MATEMSGSALRFVRRRAAVKAKITNQFAIMADDASPVNISSCKSIIGKLLVDINNFDTEISDIMSDSMEGETISDALSAELSSQASYLTSVYNKLASFPDTAPEGSAGDKKSISVSDCKLKLPELKCETFNGEGTSHLQYHSFITQFNNIVGLRSNLSDSTKLTYLKTFLKGYAYK